ncbi:MAG: type II secretion system F family protein, partial [Pseudomonadota bacterium]
MADVFSLIAAALDEPARFAPPVAAVSVATAVTALLWPYIDERRKRLRLKHVQGAERRMRKQAADGRRRRRADDVVSLRYERPKKFYADIVERLRLGDLLKNPKMRTLVYQAGFRSPGAVIQFTALRAIAAIGFGALVAVYLPLVLNLQLPFAALALAIALAAAVGWQSPVIYLKNRLDKRKTEVRRHWPTAMDLLLICVESGMSTEAAFRKVAE